MTTKAKRRDNQAGTIYFDESRNRWRGEVQYTKYNGQKVRKKFSGTKKSEVLSKINEFKKELDFINHDLKDSKMDFESYANNWLNLVLVNKLKPSSFTRKEATLINQVYPSIGYIPMDNLKHQDVQNMVNDLKKQGLSYSTIKKAYEAVNGCYAHYRIKNEIAFNPCEGVILPENIQTDISNVTYFNKKERDLIKEEALRKYSTGKSVYRLGAAIVLLMYSGMRVGELIALTWQDVDFTERTIDINKNAVVAKEYSEQTYKLINQDSTKTYSGNRIIPMTQTAYDMLLEIKSITGGQRYVLASKNGKQISPRNINRMFHSILLQTHIAKDEKECCGVHALRHTFASMLFQNDCKTKVVSEILGHSNTKITENIYIHLIQKQKVKAVTDIDKYAL